MSIITSYPSTSISQDGDTFVITRNGQVYRVTRAAIQAFIESVTPQTFLELTDSPGTYVGQAGLVPAVNIAEDALEFVAGAANFFVSLLDGPGNFSSNALKSVRVNAGETALEYFIQTLLTLPDTPSSFSGASEYVVRVNTAANAIEFVPLATVVPANFTGGWYNYDNSAAPVAYTSGTLVLSNDTLGANNFTAYAPPGVGDIWDSSTNQFDFTSLAIGDEVEIRLDVSFTTTSPSQEVIVQLWLGVGSGSEFPITFIKSTYKSAGSQPLLRFNKLFMGTALVRDNPAEWRLTSDNAGTVDVNGWYCSVTRRGA